MFCKQLGFIIKHYKTLPSTNTFALELLQETYNKKKSINQLDKTLVIADIQTAGKGRLNRSFYSPKSGIYMTLIYVPSEPVTNPAFLTCCAAVAVYNAIKTLFSIELQIKWVNDLYYNNKKICGILAEGFISPQTKKIEGAVVGIGINLDTEAFPKELESKAGALNIKSSRKNKKVLMFQIVQNFYNLIQNPQQMLEQYKKQQLLIGKTVLVSPVINDTQKNFTAKVLDISDNAELVVQTDDGTTHFLSSGEVTLHSN